MTSNHQNYSEEDAESEHDDKESQDEEKSAHYSSDSSNYQSPDSKEQQATAFHLDSTSPHTKPDSISKISVQNDNASDSSAVKNLKLRLQPLPSSGLDVNVLKAHLAPSNDHWRHTVRSTIEDQRKTLRTTMKQEIKEKGKARPSFLNASIFRKDLGNMDFQHLRFLPEIKTSKEIMEQQ